MKISYNWLKEYIDPGVSPERLAELITMTGLEVEHVEAISPSFEGVVVGQVLSVENHPNADKLSLCKVKTDERVYQIVCGAKNMKVMDRVALALPGAILPQGIEIKETKIRGALSQGMMCSPKELGLGEDGARILILDSNLSLGSELENLLDLKDWILDIDVPPNRPDCLSILGIAREVDAITQKGVKLPSWKPEEKGGDIKDHISIRIEAPSNCMRYSARLVEGVKVGESPIWIKKRIERLGLRPINNIVDITNYVMLDRGQPLHAFDYRSIDGKTIIVRLARSGEKILTLDGEERILNNSDLVIADKKKSLAIAGIMGGLTSEITRETNCVLLESAYFAPISIRRSSKRLGLRTDSSFRFERGGDPGDNVLEALNEVAQLISDISGGRVARGAIDIKTTSLTKSSFTWRPSRTNELLGTNIKKRWMIRCLNALNLKVKITKGSKEYIVTPPSYRVDLTKEIDLIEEIARLYGYDKIPSTLPRAGLSLVKRKRNLILEDRIRNFLVNNGFLEVINYSFISPDSLTSFGLKDGKEIVKILNPLTEEQSVMRPSLIPSLMENLRYNVNYKNYDLKIFELNRVFSRDNGSTYSAKEGKKIAGLWSGMRYTESWNLSEEKVDFFDIKGLLENLFEEINIKEYNLLSKRDITYMHPGKTASIIIGDTETGYLGEINPMLKDEFDVRQPVFVFELDLNSLLRYSIEVKAYKDLPKFPAIYRDVAFLVDEGLSVKEIEETIKRIGKKFVDSVKIFDLYKGDSIPSGKKSVAYRVRYLSRERTLVDTEVSDLHNRLIKEIKKQFKAEVR